MTRLASGVRLMVSNRSTTLDELHERMKLSELADLDAGG